MADFTNADGPDVITGTNETDFIWVDFSGAEYYLRGTTDNDVIDGAGGNTDIIMLSPGTDDIRDSEGWFGILENPIAIRMFSYAEGEDPDEVGGIEWGGVQPRAMVLDFEAGTYTVEWWGNRENDSDDFEKVVDSSGTISGIRRVEGTEFGDTLRGSDFEVVLTNGAKRGEEFHLGGGADDVDGRGGIDLVLPGPVAFDQRIQNFVVNLNRGEVTNLDGSVSTVRNIEGAELNFTTDDVFIGDDGDNWVRPNGGCNNVTGAGGTDSLDYNTSGGTLTGITVRLNEGEIDNQYGGIDRVTGFEIVYASPLDDTMRGDGEANTFYGNNGNDTLLGLGGNDTLIGGFGLDQIMGNLGDDHLVGYGDNDTLQGDQGFDYADYSFEFGSSGVVVNLAERTARDTYSATDTLVDIEGAVGSEHDDTMDGNGKANRFLGGPGADTLRGGGGQDTLEGEADKDHLLGQGGGDTLKGGGGNDRLEGGAQRDELLGEVGNDKLFGDAGNDTLDGGIGNDTHEGGAGGDRIVANAGRDVYDGGAGSDAIALDGATGGVRIVMENDAMGGGGFGKNTIRNVEIVFGTEFEDVFRGDGEDNRLFGFDSKDRLFGEGGDDRLFGGVGSDALDGGNGDDLLDGDRELPGETGRVGQGNDTLIGGAGDDSLDGGRGDDLLRGGDNDDILDGGPGNDRLTGGSGTDIFVFSTGSDTVLDFDVNEDILDVSGRNGGLAFADLDALLDAASGGTGVNATSRITQDGNVLTLTKVGLNFLDEIEIRYA